MLIILIIYSMLLLSSVGVEIYVLVTYGHFNHLHVVFLFPELILFILLLILYIRERKKNAKH